MYIETPYLVEDKIHARSIDRIHVTQQPLGARLV
jgi:DNA-directed RNA polymerase beta subunit